MTKETKAGIAVSCAFLALAGTVLWNRMGDSKDQPETDDTTPVKVADASPPSEDGAKHKSPAESKHPGLHGASEEQSSAPPEVKPEPRLAPAPPPSMLVPTPPTAPLPPTEVKPFPLPPTEVKPFPVPMPPTEVKPFPVPLPPTEVKPSPEIKPPTEVAPPVITPPVVSPPIVTPPIVSPPVITPPTIALPVVTPPVVAPPTPADPPQPSASVPDDGHSHWTPKAPVVTPPAVSGVRTVSGEERTPMPPPAPVTIPIPAPAVTPPRVGVSEERRVAIQTGDTFDTIARREYAGHAEYATPLRNFNQNDPFASDNVKAGKLVPGETITIPAAERLQGLPAIRPAPVDPMPMKPPAPTVPPAASYKVTAPGGETMLAIAAKVLGKEDRWMEIGKANPAVSPERLVPPGTVLVLPADARVPPENR